MPDRTPIRRASSAEAPQSLGAYAWIRGHEKFLRTMCMVAAYVFGALFLISLLAIGAVALVSGLFAGIFLISLLSVFVLLRLKPRRG